jgi:hypothetical protein
MVRSALIIALIGSAGLIACSDDSKAPLDKGPVADRPINVDKPVVTPDKPVPGNDAKADKPSSKEAAVAKKVEEYMPANNEITGWIQGPPCGVACTSAGSECGTHTCLSTSKCSCVQAGYTKLDIEAIIDGSNDPYDALGVNGFAYEVYTKGTVVPDAGVLPKIELFVWDMKTAAAAKQMFDKDKADDETAGVVFEVITGVTDGGIIGSTTAKYKAYGYKSHYVFKIYGLPKDAATKTDTTNVVKNMTGKLP